ncbi:MAG TPA: hypothetical protein GXZ77_01840 [Papillibacter sp.]|nr:hypothetical protein [Papillibacter sp.]
MAATAERIYRAALALMDEPEAYEHYKSRAIAVLNLLCGELALRFGPSEAEGRRPAVREVAEMTEELELDEAAARLILPYGLAAHLMSDVSPDTANFFQQRYEELVFRALDAYTRRPEPIEDVYGGISGEAAPWR